MKNCQFCDREIPLDSNICPYCGKRVRQPQYESHTPHENPYDKGGCGWVALGFFFPIVGLILYLVWQHEKPITAKAAGKGALISVVLSIIPAILFIIFMTMFSFAAMAMVNYSLLFLIPYL
ncbi:MAG: zinc ribbon domain-containing protein [Bacillota bacterium]|jgi:hypothetical protein|nr:zinc ribbon domain-containing protein [Bacillota bacterium]HHU44026.1 zinc ribbon domain-containing protein [Clostridiales bacterium]